MKTIKTCYILALPLILSPLASQALELNIANEPLSATSNPVPPNVMLLIDDSGSMGGNDVFYSKGYNFNKTYQCAEGTTIIEPDDNKVVHAKIDKNSKTGYFGWGNENYGISGSVSGEHYYYCSGDAAGDDLEYLNGSNWVDSTREVFEYKFLDGDTRKPAAPGLSKDSCRGDISGSGSGFVRALDNRGTHSNGYDYRTKNNDFSLKEIKTGYSETACFRPDKEYNVYIKADTCDSDTCVATQAGQDERVPSRLDGNYLNWYFSDNDTVWIGDSNNYTKPSNEDELVVTVTQAATDFDDSDGYKSGTKINHDRMEVARDVAQLLVGFSTDLRIGISSFNGSNGGEIDKGLVTVGNFNTDAATGGTESTAYSANRTSLFNAVGSLYANGSTPLGESMATLARYFAKRPDNTNDVLHSSFSDEKSANVVFKSSGKNYAINSADASAWGNSSSGDNNDEWCRKSYIVAMTDGEPTSDSSVYNESKDWITQVRGETDDYDGSNEKANDVAAAMFDIDFRPDIKDFQGQDVLHNIITYTIGFGKDVATGYDGEFLRDTANKGGGQFFSASSGVELAAAFRSIKGAIKSAGNAVAAVAVSAVSELKADNFIYKAGYNTASWSGSLKAYAINDDGQFVDGVNDASNDSIDVNAAWDTKDVVNQMYVETGHTNYRALSNRRIYTMGCTAGGCSAVPFNATNLNNLPTAIKNDLNAYLGDTTKLINFLRGDTSEEDVLFRTRLSKNGSGEVSSGSILGDIVNSSPEYLADAPRPWDDFNFGEAGARYSSFKNTVNENRAGMLYFGANDGMVHAVTPNDVGAGNQAKQLFPKGAELWAYMPSFVASTEDGKGLRYLADKQYEHEFYVDAKPVISEVYWNHDNAGQKIIADNNSNAAKEWRSILTGGVGAGGKGFYAIDITCPYASFDKGTCADERMLNPQSDAYSVSDKANFAKNLLWEFHGGNIAGTDAQYLGYTFGSPIVAKVKIDRGTASNLTGNDKGEWAVIANNGYQSESGKAALIIIFIDGLLNGGGWEKNKDYFILHANAAGVSTPNPNDTAGVHANGLSSPTAVDITEDGVMDYVYAGDLKGNMWVFDISDTEAKASNYDSAWSAQRLFQAGNLTTASDTPSNDLSGRQSITSAPRIQRNVNLSKDDPNLMVMFGTGLYIQDIDILPTAYAFQQQSFYGVLHSGTTQDDVDLTRANLKQRFLHDSLITVDGSTRRVRSVVDEVGRNNSVNGSTADTNGSFVPIDWSTQKGWYFNFDDGHRTNSAPALPGERVVYDPFLINDTITITTLIPTNAACSGGLRGFTFAVDWKTGMPPEFSIFDANSDDSIDSLDEGWLGMLSETGAGQSSFIDGYLLTTEGQNTNSKEWRTSKEVDGRRLGWEEKFPYGVAK